MLANPKEIIADATKRNYAIAGMNVTTQEGIDAVILAAESLNTPVMLSFAQVHNAYFPIEKMGPLMVLAAKEAKVPVIVHLDHGMDRDFIMKAVRYGFTSIMYDCSTRLFEENIAELSAFAELAHKLDIIVEAELGQMPSNIMGQGGCVEPGVVVSNIEQTYTNPDQALEFCVKTGVDLLTVSFGSIHGFPANKPNLNIPLLKSIYEKTKGHASLVMHGTTGVPANQVTDAINNGVRKFNYFTGLGTAPAAKVAEYIAAAREPVYYHEIAKLSVDIMTEHAKQQITLFSNGAQFAC
ncbi:MAG: class II fructose-bisphosphate aldolase [Spirochaetales bacterium]|jgi:fructose-bisphosphate aldolase class II|nr:class II fructose-bisphosphate aldolase [Spirochaetales bacterium]